MALSLAIGCSIVDELGAPVLDAYYQGCFFRRVGSASPTVKWSGVRHTTNGQLTINVGSSDWLGPEGSVATGDEILLAVWTDEAARTGTNPILKSNFSFRTFYLDGSPFYVLSDFPCLADRPPTASPSFPSRVPRGQNATITLSGSDSFTVGVSTQQRTYSGQTVFDATGISAYEIDWGDGSPIVTVPGPTYNHTYTLQPPNSATISVRSIDPRGNYSSPATLGVEVAFVAPIPDFTWDPISPTITEDATFSTGPAEEDVDGRASSWEYRIVDTGGPYTYPLLSAVETLAYRFLAQGGHSVSRVIGWDDGFETQYATTTKTVTVQNLSPTAGLSYTLTDASAVLIEASDLSTDPDGSISTRAWALDLWNGASWDQVATQSGASPSFSRVVTVAGVYRIRLTVTDSGGATASYTSDGFPVTPTGGGGTIYVQGPARRSGIYLPHGRRVRA